MSKEDELAKEQAEVVPNTYGDLHDAPLEYIEILSSGKVGETKTIPQDTVILVWITYYLAEHQK